MLFEMFALEKQVVNTLVSKMIISTHTHTHIRAPPRTAPRMSGELSVSVQSVTSAPMATDNCKDVCQQALGFVTCKVSGTHTHTHTHTHRW